MCVNQNLSLDCLWLRNFSIDVSTNASKESYIIYENRYHMDEMSITTTDNYQQHTGPVASREMTSQQRSLYPTEKWSRDHCCMSYSENRSSTTPTLGIGNFSPSLMALQPEHLPHCLYYSMAALKSQLLSGTHRHTHTRMHTQMCKATNAHHLFHWI